MQLSKATLSATLRQALIRLTLTLPLLTAFIPNSAQAVLMAADDAVFGAGAITVDTATDLEWLDVNLSVARSFNDVSAEFGLGGDFAGFRHATQAEVLTLFTDAGIPQIGAGLTVANFTPVGNLQGLVGLTFRQTVLPFTFLTLGATGTLNDFGTGHFAARLTTEIQGILFRGLADVDDNNFATVPEGLLRDIDVDSFAGHWLVRPSQVSLPEPGTLLLVFLGLLGVVRSIANRRKR